MVTNLLTYIGLPYNCGPQGPNQSSIFTKTSFEGSVLPLTFDLRRFGLREALQKDKSCMAQANWSSVGAAFRSLLQPMLHEHKVSGLRMTVAPGALCAQGRSQVAWACSRWAVATSAAMKTRKLRSMQCTALLRPPDCLHSPTSSRKVSVHVTARPDSTRLTHVSWRDSGCWLAATWHHFAPYHTQCAEDEDQCRGGRDLKNGFMHNVVHEGHYNW